MSGAMKSMMKATKHALKTFIKERPYADDTLYTVMTDVESKVNKRPLTNVSDNIDDYEALTPNYFLLKQRSMFWSISSRISSNVNRAKKVVVTQRTFEKE